MPFLTDVSGPGPKMLEMLAIGLHTVCAQNTQIMVNPLKDVAPHELDHRKDVAFLRFSLARSSSYIFGSIK